MKRVTEAQVLQIAASRPFFVHKYRYRDQQIRKLTRRMCKDGKLTMIMFDGRYFHYRKSKNYEQSAGTQGRDQPQGV